MQSTEQQEPEEQVQVQLDNEPAEGPGNSESEMLAHAVTRYRELVASMPGLVPGMVRGDTVEEIDASAEQARQAYENISRRITESMEAQVPTGNTTRSTASESYSAMKPEDKIAVGLRKL